MSGERSNFRLLLLSALVEENAIYRVWRAGPGPPTSARAVEARVCIAARANEFRRLLHAIPGEGPAHHPYGDAVPSACRTMVRAAPWWPLELRSGLGNQFCRRWSRSDHSSAEHKLSVAGIYLPESCADERASEAGTDFIHPKRVKLPSFCHRAFYRRALAHSASNSMIRNATRKVFSSWSRSGL